MDNLDLLTINDSSRWDEVLEEIGAYDFHHLSSYHRLAEVRGEGKAAMLVYRKDSTTIAFPFLIRDIDLPMAEGIGQSYKDVTSAHGYTGPLASAPVITEDTRKDFLCHLREFLGSYGVIAAFTRLHPVLMCAPILDGCGEIIDIGVTTSIDLTVPPETQVANYRKGHRYEIGRLRKLGFSCQEAGSDSLDDFIDIYYTTMDRVGATEDYYYDSSYFDYLLSQMSDTIHLFTCKDGDTVACVGLFGTCKGMIQYHLAGTAPEYLRLAPMKLMIDTVREWGNQQGAHTFHLGGGVGARRDSLYEFKMGFCGREHTFSGWKYVANPPAYREICDAVQRHTGIKPEGSYFPAYRDPCYNWQSKNEQLVATGKHLEDKQ